MITSINNNRINSYTSPPSHIITDSTETIKLLEQKCGYQKPWTIEDNNGTNVKSKQVEPKKTYNKIDFFL